MINEKPLYLGLWAIAGQEDMIGDTRWHPILPTKKYIFNFSMEKKTTLFFKMETTNESDNPEEGTRREIFRHK